MPRRNLKGFVRVHLISRSIDKQKIFVERSMKALTLKLIREASIRTGVDVHAYALMDNHYHLLASGDAGRVSRMMYAVNRPFSFIYNRRKGRSGPLFDGRFKSFQVFTDAWAANVSAYIHLNAVLAGLARSASAYPWSSAGYFTGVRTAPAWLKPGYVLSHFSRTRATAFADYARYLERQQRAEQEDVFVHEIQL